VSLRRIAYPLRLVLARLTAGGERLVLVSFGVVAGAAVIAAVLGGRLVMQDRALVNATKQLPGEEHSIAVAWFGGYGGTWKALDGVVAPTMQRTLGRAPARAMLFREASIQDAWSTCAPPTTSGATCDCCPAGCRPPACRRTARCCDSRAPARSRRRSTCG